MKTAKAFRWLNWRLKEAALTLYCLRLSRHDLPDGHGSYWPGVVRSASEAYGYEGDPGFNIPGEQGYRKGLRIIPEDTKEQKRRRWERLNRRITAIERGRIDRMDEVLGWLLWLTGEERRIVWGRAEGRSWDQLHAAVSVRTLQRKRDRALGAILLKLQVG